MPANLTPAYKAAEDRYRAATGHEEKREALREMIALLPVPRAESIMPDPIQPCAFSYDQLAVSRSQAVESDPARLKR